MKPSEIAAKESEINAFKYTMLTMYANFVDKIVDELKESNDLRHIAFNKQRLELATAYIEIMIDFFTATTEEDGNFFTNEEFYDVVKHLNNIFGTFYWIDLD